MNAFHLKIIFMLKPLLKFIRLNRLAPSRPRRAIAGFTVLLITPFINGCGGGSGGGGGGALVEGHCDLSPDSAHLGDDGDEFGDACDIDYAGAGLIEIGAAAMLTSACSKRHKALYLLMKPTNV